MADNTQNTGSDNTEVVDKKYREQYYRFVTGAGVKFTHVNTEDTMDYVGICLNEYGKPSFFMKGNYTAAIIAQMFNYGCTFDSAVARLMHIYADDPTATKEAAEESVLVVFRDILGDPKWDPDALVEKETNTDTPSKTD